MLRRIVKPALSALARTSPRLLLNSVRPSFGFANEIEAASKLKSILQQEIKHEQQNKQDLTQFTNYFENQGWKVKYDGVQVELSKKNGLYNLRLLFNARSPMSDYNDQSQQQNPEGQQPEDQDFSEIAAYINKDGASKWLALDFMVFGTNQSQIASASFINDYEAEKVERKKGRVYNGGYNGPDMSSLDDKLHESIFSFIETAGINGQLLLRASQFSVSYEQQFYVNWLKDLRSIV